MATWDGMKEYGVDQNTISYRSLLSRWQLARHREVRLRKQQGDEGLGVETRDGESQHFGAALFNRGEYALHELDLLAQRHPTSQRRRCND